jgi:hypothetical protein
MDSRKSWKTVAMAERRTPAELRRLRFSQKKTFDFAWKRSRMSHERLLLLVRLEVFSWETDRCTRRETVRARSGSWCEERTVQAAPTRESLNWGRELVKPVAGKTLKLAIFNFF